MIILGIIIMCILVHIASILTDIRDILEDREEKR